MVIASVPRVGAFNPTWSFRALLQHTCELRISWFPAQRWQGVLSWWQHRLYAHAEKACPAAFTFPAFPALLLLSQHQLLTSTQLLFYAHPSQFFSVISVLEYTGENTMMFIVTGIWNMIIFAGSPDGANLSEGWNKLSGWNTSKNLSTKQFY